ncbi:hypothetical protein ANCCAN_04688 [Ancylostoma caninum]|uniref:7TM GPCR serpentine receptor class x (Srx) domain-containing protein n=1 Tax=Ancylostoma caninum TaxID=29170 RepID=A0A368GY35_ANCCA|nr:hypothetical protein ANCCAN_04688 [Ancylostoma caninum]
MLQGLGSLAKAPYFLVIILNIIMSFHRLVYTALPLTASRHLSKPRLQIVLGAVLLLFLSLVVMLNTNLVGVIWMGNFMTWTVIYNRNYSIHILDILNTVSFKALCMVICEIVFFLYWQFADTEAFGPLDLIVSEVIELLFFDVLILPYLILNGVHRVTYEFSTIVFSEEGNAVARQPSTPDVLWAEIKTMTPS